MFRLSTVDESMDTRRAAVGRFRLFLPIVECRSLDVIAALFDLLSQVVERQTRPNRFRSSLVVTRSAYFSDFFDDLQQIRTFIFDSRSASATTIELVQLRMQFRFRLEQMLDLA
jgi:hypothetical protein